LKWTDAVRGADRRNKKVAPEIIAAIENDLNTPEVIGELHRLAKIVNSSDGEDDPVEAMNQLLWALDFLGFEEHQRFLKESDALDQATKMALKTVVDNKIIARSEARKRKDFKESDRIRDELDKMGIALKDSKNKETGEIETTWEVKR
jgi:cysteinyl-tRNA synthetase